jgi:NDP-4-keto-2,6-dideoxyhexose 3-C-methyltransferase
MMYKKINKCRICGNKKLESVYALKDQALTGMFPKHKDAELIVGPLELVKCQNTEKCGLVQLKHSYDPAEMYGDNYGYRSGLNSSMVTHLKSKVDKIKTMVALAKGDVLIDIGSNDGTTLGFYQKDRFKLIGVDPTAAKFRKYYRKDIQVVENFFPSDELTNILNGQKAKIITSFSMFYDLEDPVSFAKEIASTLCDNGIWIFEQSYIGAMLETNSFDTICHEHIEFYGLKQINYILELAQLKIVDIEFNEINGGSISISAAKYNADYLSPVNQIAEILQFEDQSGITDGSAFKAFKDRIYVEKEKLTKFLVKCKSEGKRICGVGASTKGNVLLQHYQITSELMECIAEVNPEKFGCFTPSTNIPLMNEDDVLNSNPDYLVVLPWHFKEFFLKNPKFKGRTLVFPLPKFEIIEITG